MTDVNVLSDQLQSYICQSFNSMAGVTADITTLANCNT